MFHFMGQLLEGHEGIRKQAEDITGYHEGIRKQAEDNTGYHEGICSRVCMDDGDITWAAIGLRAASRTKGFYRLGFRRRDMYLSD